MIDQPLDEIVAAPAPQPPEIEFDPVNTDIVPDNAVQVYEVPQLICYSCKLPIADGKFKGSGGADGLPRHYHPDCAQAIASRSKR